jgi:rhamnose utilization protein RhaD (predicted bifunctional aldolase and dehydrogenase)
MRSGNDTPGTERLEELVRLSLRLSEPARELAILAEGNTSARIDEEAFWVKASGTSLAEADGPDKYVAVRIEPLMAALGEQGEIDDGEAKRRLQSAALGDPEDLRSPSIETYVHAACLELGGATFVAHTHPTALNALLCSERAEAAYEGVLFPDEAVVCGPRPLIVPYAAPGLALGRLVLQRLNDFLSVGGEPPRAILLINHGLFALGASGEEAAAITAMVVKAAQIRLGALAAGGLRFLPSGEAERLYEREDERGRRRQLAR